jgi:CRP/FNR family transcriptional regulator, cyclic AMP receptor protein
MDATISKGSSNMNEDTLAHVDLFSTLDKKELQVLAKSSQERTYNSDSTIFLQGDIGVGLYVVKSGKIRLTQSNNPDRAEIDLGTAGPGEVMGEMALLDDLPRSATATAQGDVDVLVLPVWEFRSVLRQHPDITLKLLASLSRRLRKVEARRREW